MTRHSYRTDYDGPVLSTFVDEQAGLARVAALMARGEYLAAYDTACATSNNQPLDQLRLDYLRVLALARTGATERAQQELEVLRSESLEIPDDLGEDIAAVTARIAKDRATSLTGSARLAAAADAARAYEEVYVRFGRAYGCVNAATWWRLAGEHARAAELARQAVTLARSEFASAAADVDRYWAAVTQAEALLVLGEVGAATARLLDAGTVAVDNYGARATTRRQLSLLCDAIGLDAHNLLRPIANPDVVHFCGHLLGRGRLTPDDLPRVRAELESLVTSRRIGFAYGALAAGADILAAEVFLEHGAALHVVLPFSADEFVETSVRPAGDGWVDRFHHCLAAAASVTVACESAYLGDDELFGFASSLAMGKAVNRSVSLVSTVTQFAVWDGEPTGIAAGTAHDIEVWRASGHESVVVRLPPGREAQPTVARSSRRRPIHAVLFGDLRGFSSLRDEQMFPFIEHVMGAIAAALSPFGDSVVGRNTWGDGLFVAFDGVATAANAALAIQDTLSALDLGTLGLPEELQMRLAAHVGPVISALDPVRGTMGLFGRELTRAARIEPSTPPGEVYSTDAFAALLALDGKARVRPEYVGVMTTAKAFETAPIYVLKRTAGSEVERH
jgi:adenylate cyclase